MHNKCFQMKLILGTSAFDYFKPKSILDRDTIGAFHCSSPHPPCCVNGLHEEIILIGVEFLLKHILSMQAAV